MLASFSDHLFITHRVDKHHPGPFNPLPMSRAGQLIQLICNIEFHPAMIDFQPHIFGILRRQNLNV